MMGIVVEVVLGVRRRIPISTTAYCVPVKTGQAVASRLAELRTANDAMFAILVPDRSYVYVELRKKVRIEAGRRVLKPAAVRTHACHVLTCSATLPCWLRRRRSWAACWRPTARSAWWRRWVRTS